MSIDVASGDYASLTEEEQFCLEGCRSYKQYYGMRKGFEGGVCAFCNPDPELNQIVWQDDFMRVWHVHPKFMRPELRLHVLIVPKQHVRFLADLSIGEWVSLGCATQFAKMHFGYTGGLFHAREGNMRNNAGTVPHLHINIFEPSGTAEVRVPVFKNPKDREENERRARRFSKFYVDGVTPEKFDQLVYDRVVDKDGWPFRPKE